MAEFFKGIVDQRGEPIRKGELLTEQAPASVRGVRQPYGEHPAAGLTPGRLAAILRESIEGDPIRYLELAEDMEERHEHYASVLATRKLQVSSLEISVEPASEDANDIANADLVREFVSRPEFQEELIDILDALGKGFSCTEIIWETSERQWMPKRLEYRLPTWFTFDRTDLDTIKLRGEEGEEVLRPFQWIVHRAKAKSGLTIRGGLARICAWSFFFKAFTAKDWAIFCEAYGQPLRVGKYGPGATQEDKDTLLRAVSAISSDYAAIIPESMAIDFIEAKLSGTHELYEKRSEYLDRQVSKVVLGQVGTTDAVAGGFSGNKVHNEVRGDIADDDGRKLGATITRDLAIPLVMLNRGPQKRYPVVKVGRPDEEDVEALVRNVRTLVPLGMEVGMDAMRKKIGAPAPQEGEKALGLPRRQNTEPETPDEKTVDATAAAARLSPDQDSIERAVDEALNDQGWHELVAPIVDGLEEELAAAASLEEAKAIIERRSETMSLSKMTELLARYAFAARLAGETDQELS